MSAFDPLGSNLIFIVSLPRSGSTLLQRILGGNSQVHTVAEPWFMLHPVYALRELGIETEYDANLARQGLEDFIEQLDNGRQVYIDAVRDWAAKLYGAALQESGKRIFVDKTPRYYRILPELREIFPRAQFVFLLRNPAAILSSVLQTWFHNDVSELRGSSNHLDLTEGVECLVEGLRLFGNQASVVRYEELVTSPGPTVHALCERVGLPFEEGMLDYGSSVKPAGRHGDQVGINRHDRAVSYYANKWHENLREDERNRFALDYLLAIGPDRIAALGYDYNAIESVLRGASETVPTTLAGPQSPADAINAAGEVLFAQGDLAGAERKFRQALAEDDGFVLAHNNLAVLYWHQGLVDKSLGELAKGLKKDSLQRELVINAGQIFSAAGMQQEAERIYASYLDRVPSDQEVVLMREELSMVEEAVTAESPVAVAQDSPSGESCSCPAPATSARTTVPIVTSIAPKGIEKQKRAIQSWLDLGFEVLSLNIQKEIDLLQPEFPGVTFVRAPRDGSRRAGRPYVYIDDMLSVLAKTGHQVVGIVNSDIVLRAQPSLPDYLAQEARGCFLYGSRIDIDQPDDGAGRVYHRGFDIFFFDRSVIGKIPSTDFMLGIPWWDYWLPFAPLLHNITVKRIETPLAYHVWHETNYSDEHLVVFGGEFAAQCAQAPFIDLYQQCVDGNYGNVRYSVLSDAALDYLARNSERLYLPTTVTEVVQHPKERALPRVTAIVSTYNSEAFIGECLHDLVNQTIADQIEIIVIDAASPQNERAIVERFQQQHPNIRYHRTPERIGVYAAWNLVAKMARGEYLITCSTNDRLRNDACEILARALDEHDDVALVYGNSFLTKSPHETFDKHTICGLYVWPEYSYETLLDRCMVGPHPMWRRRVHDTVGYFDEDLVALGDQDFWLRLGQQYELLNLPDFTGLYYVSESSITGDTDLTQIETDTIHSQYGWRHRYGQWFARRYVRDAASAENGDHDSLMQLVVIASGSAGERLADTLDSIASQQYGNWQLTVLSEAPCPDPLFMEEPRLEWKQCAGQQALGDVLNAVVESGGADWIAVLNEGEQLAPTFLSDCRAYASKHPEWKLVYCDDDRVSEQGELSDPRFKPDFNLELLRAGDYIGNTYLLSRGALERSGGFGRFDYAFHFDLVLRVHDSVGPQSIGHMADVLWHRTGGEISPSEELAVSQRREALQQHLQRCDEDAVVQDGVLSGTFMLDYRVSSWPKVSILLEAAGNSDQLSASLQTLLTRTDYPNFEVRVLSALEKDAASSELLQAIASTDPRVIVVQTGMRNRTDALNRLAADADGDYLLWLRDGVVALQPNWLTRLVQHGVRGHVGIVGARIVTRRKTLLGAGIVLGVGARGVGARGLAGIHMSSPGYMGRAQLAQETGAVPGLCMLLAKDLFEQVGGYDTRLSVALYRDVDLCLRVESKGKRTIWTPHATLMYLGDGLQIDGRAEDEKQVKAQIRHVQQNWLHKLAADRSYNRNLSLSRSDFSLETATIPQWDAAVDDRLRVLSFAVGSYGSWQYRVKQPLDVMAGAGTLQRTHFPLVGRKRCLLPSVVEVERLQPDSLLMHNTMHDYFIDAMEAYKRVNNAFIVFGQDDLMTALPPKNPFSKSMYKDMKKRVRKSLSLADRLVVTTEPLAAALEGMADDIRVVPNYLDAEIWSGLQSQRGTAAKPRVGWAGAQQHLGDLELLHQVVMETAGEVDWVFFGMCPDAIKPFVREVHDAVLFEDYPAKLAALDLDLALAPLERNKFNEAKSNLRILEYGILGWPVIATDIEPYRDGPVCRVQNQPRAWINAIRERIHDRDAAWREGDLLREWVETNWLLQQHAGEWLEALRPSHSTATRRYVTDKAAGL